MSCSHRPHVITYGAEAARCGDCGMTWRRDDLGRWVPIGSVFDREVRDR